MKEYSIEDILNVINGGSVDLMTDHALKLSSAATGRTATDKTKQTLSEAKVGKSVPRAICPHCGKEKGAQHINKCSQNPNSTKSKRQTKREIQRKIAHETGTFRNMKGVGSQRCTVDGITIYPSHKALIEALGQGLKGRRHPNFRYVDKDIEDEI